MGFTVLLCQGTHFRVKLPNPNGENVSIKSEVGMVVVGVEQYAAKVVGAEKSQSLQRNVGQMAAPNVFYVASKAMWYKEGDGRCV